MHWSGLFLLHYKTVRFLFNVANAKRKAQFSQSWEKNPQTVILGSVFTVLSNTAIHHEVINLYE